MPLIGSASGNGEVIVGAATTSCEWDNLAMQGGGATSTDPLRCENLSRVTATVIAVAGGVGGTGILEVRISNTFYPIATFAIAAVGTPVSLTQHIACKDVRLSINPGLGGGTFDIVMMATGTS